MNQKRDDKNNTMFYECHSLGTTEPSPTLKLNPPLVSKVGLDIQLNVGQNESLSLNSTYLS